jgi:5-methyltetrahydropteroyltriglutamate--homocysteine methyltransferase
MKRSADRILTTHAGSLVRSPAIVEAMIRAHLGEPMEEREFGEALRRGVAEVVRRQAELGVDLVSDGEFGKSSWINYLADRIRGLERIPPERSPASRYSRGWPDQDRFGEFYRVYDQYETLQWLPDTPSKLRYDGNQGTEYLTVVCTGPLEYQPGPLQRDIDNLRAALEHVAVEDAFLPVVAPASIEIVPNRHYASQEEYLFALAGVLNVEYKMIIDAGFVLQVDDAILPMQRFMLFRDKSLAEYHEWAALRVEALNRALDGIPEERVRYHVCFGSQNVPHTADPALRDILDLVLGVNAQAYSIEACNPRHEHEWQVWEGTKLPEGKILIPGVLSHATNIVEHPELIALRLENFARLIGRENVVAGSDCGFSQSWNSPRVHPQVQWAKIEAMVEGARIASKALWR